MVHRGKQTHQARSDQLLPGSLYLSETCYTERMACRLHYHGMVALVGAIGQPDLHSGEVPCAYVELVQGAKTDANELLKFVQEKLDNKLAMPVYIEILTELPKTAVGKIFKPDLRKRAIVRVLNAEMQSKGIQAEVTEVFEDKVSGLTAIISGEGSSDLKQEVVGGALNQFTVPWRKL